MRFTLPSGHALHLTPWLLRAVRAAVPLPGDPERLAPYVSDRSVAPILVREGVAAPDGNGDLVLTEQGRELHRLATAPEPATESPGGRLSYSSELTPEELAEVRGAEARLRAGERAYLLREPLPAPARFGMVAALLFLGMVPFFAEWHLTPFGLLSLYLFVGVGHMVLTGRADRYRSDQRARRPGAVLRRYSRRCLAPAALDSVARELLLRVQRAVDASPDPAALAEREWELARELARSTLRRRAIEDLSDPDERVLELMGLLADLARTEERVRGLEQGTAQGRED